MVEGLELPIEWWVWLDVLQVEDTRRVTPAALVIVDDSCLFICFEIR